MPFSTVIWMSLKFCGGGISCRLPKIGEIRNRWWSVAKRGAPNQPIRFFSPLEGEDQGEGPVFSCRFTSCICRGTISWRLLSFQAEPILPACQRDHFSGRCVIVGCLPRGLSLVIKSGCGTTDDFIECSFFGKPECVPLRPNVDPQ